MVEQLEDCESKEQFARFSLNGEVLPSQAITPSSSEQPTWVELVPLQAMAERIRTQEKVTAAL